MKTPSYEEALEIYLEALTSGKSVHEVAAKAGFPVGSISGKICYMRKKGVKIPTIRSGRQRTLNVAKLNRLVKDLIG